MYDIIRTVGTNEIGKIHGVGRNATLKLCQERPYGFPVVRIGRNYRADESKLLEWRDRLYSGEFGDDVL